MLDALSDFVDWSVVSVMMNELFSSIIWVDAGQHWWLLVPVCCAIGLLFFKVFKTLNIVALIAPAGNKMKLLKHFSYTKVYIKALLMCLTVLLLYAALMRPQWGKKDEVLKQTGRDLFIALDISRSMLVTDCPEQRLACAKKKIKELVAVLSCERIGLILFSGSAFIQCPLTTDYGAFFLFLDTVDVETIASGGTSLQKAITTALDVYQSMPSKKNKLLAIFSDGEDFSQDMLSVKNRAQQEGLSIFTVGIGSIEGGPIPLFDEKGKLKGHQKDTHGSVVISRLNEKSLYDLSIAVGGHYVRVLSHDTADVMTIAKKVAAFEKEQFEDIKHHSFIDRYHWFVGGALTCLLIEWIL
ncbi:VWA domain-containing protein [bacterium]|nr:MAG: VWA domain-containing protein [bacterium]QQR61937.1 MAG: VWA domain-containing protein [bacterium]QQR62472.1 MAG: VWA domain-containing protein [bacterium]